MVHPEHPNATREARRAFLRASAAMAGWSLLSGSASARAGVRLSRWTGGGAGPPRTLVLLQLAGGNDGLNAVPFHGDDEYYNLRPDLAHDRNDVLVLDDYRGLHPDLVRLWELYDEGRVALIEGVGYPEPNRSHFKSFEIWHTARLEGRNSGEGWIGRLMEELHPGAPAPNRVVHVGTQVPYSLYSTQHPPVAFEVPSGYAWAGNASWRQPRPRPTEAAWPSGADGARGPVRISPSRLSAGPWPPAAGGGPGRPGAGHR